MGWTIAILFIAAIVLLVISYVKNSQSAKNLEQQIDQVSFAFKDEIYQLQQQLRNVEIDVELTAQEAGIATDSSERSLRHELLSLYKRGYSIESISEKTKQSRDEVERILAPFGKSKMDERNGNA